MVGDAVQFLTVGGHEIKLIEAVAITDKSVNVRHETFEHHEISIPVINNEIEDCILIYDFGQNP